MEQRAHIIRSYEKEKKKSRKSSQPTTTNKSTPNLRLQPTQRLYRFDKKI